MEKITKYSDYLNEATVEIEDTEEGVYVLTLHDIHNIVNQFTDIEINENDILEELQDYKFVKVEDAEIKKDDFLSNFDKNEYDSLMKNNTIDELSSDDENPNFIKKFEES